MTTFKKSAAITALTLTTALAAPFAASAAPMSDLNSMTCSEYNDLSVAEQNAVAIAAVAELSDNAAATIEDNNGVAKATDPLVGEKAEESASGSANTIADSDGTATATSTVPAGNDEVRFAEEIKILNLTCERNGDAMILEAAAGMSGTR